jgi:type IV fimbrial biogenesis protein FimT
MLRLRSTAGFSLVEMMVTLAVLAVLLAAAGPMLAQWTANARVRSVAEELQNGIRLAQNEAVRRNRQVVFGFTNAAPGLDAEPAEGGRNWFVRALPLAGEAADESFFVGGGTFANESQVTITARRGMTDVALMCFNSLGRLVANGATGLGADCLAPSDTVAPIAVDVSRDGADRPLRVQVFLGGQVRMCDPARSRSDAPDGC